ncbi:hypothetical protein GCM10023186_39370 [Hymenobacter koreensis]|uniref:Uncharacterized protein n=1 Tax=Hymenobacter koreensis TaxID=1084523 RepID=A0ABP8JHD4_9BACT
MSSQLRIENRGGVRRPKKAPSAFAGGEKNNEYKGYLGKPEALGAGMHRAYRHCPLPARPPRPLTQTPPDWEALPADAEPAEGIRAKLLYR